MPIPFIVNNFSEYYQRQREIEQLKKRRVQEQKVDYSKSGKCTAAISNINPAGCRSAAGAKPKHSDTTNQLMDAVLSSGKETGPSPADKSISGALVKGEAVAVEGRPVPGNGLTSFTIPTGTGPPGTGNGNSGLVIVWEEKKKPAVGNGRVKNKAVGSILKSRLGSK